MKIRDFNSLIKPPVSAVYRAPRGFTFTEVMFAVIILGIGFIMIAAIFPVAIRQGQSSAEESVAITEAQRVFAGVSLDAKTTLFPVTSIDFTAPSGSSPTDPRMGQVVGLGEVYFDQGRASMPIPLGYPTGTNIAQVMNLQWNAFRGELVSRTDGRFGVALAYLRTGQVTYPTGEVVAPSDKIQVIAVVAQSRNRPVFNDADSGTGADSEMGELAWGRDIRIPLATGNNNYDQVQNQRLGPKDQGGQGTPATLQFKRLRAAFLSSPNSGEQDIIEFTTNAAALNQSLGHYSCVAPGTFVIVSDAGGSDPTRYKITTSATDALNARANGKIFRIGEGVAGSEDSSGNFTKFYLQGGQDVKSLSVIDRPPYVALTATPSVACDVLVLGRSLKSPAKAGGWNAVDNPYVGTAMDVAVYTTSFTLK